MEKRVGKMEDMVNVGLPQKKAREMRTESRPLLTPKDGQQRTEHR